MFKTLKYLFLIRFRKIFSKDDFFAFGLLVISILGFTYFFQINYSKYSIYLSIFILQILSLQINRKDLDFLKLNTGFRIILILEYTILSLPILVLLALNTHFLVTLIYSFAILVITFLNKTNSKTFRYPFKMFDVFWTITFRKYKLFWLLPFLGFIIFMGFKYQNQNLQYFVLLIGALVLCAPSSEREKLYFIKASAFMGKQYLWQQVKTTIYNSLFFVIPISVLLLVLQEFYLLLIVPFLVFFPIVNLLFKYVYFDRIIVHNIFFALFLGFIIYGFPLIFIPILYFKSIKNLIKIQNA